jgi:hypothetical protein
MTPTARPTSLRLLTALAAAVCLAPPIALAATPPTVRATDVPFADGVGGAGIDLAWDDGLVLVLGVGGQGALGDALVPAYDTAVLPTDALGSVVAAASLEALGIVEAFAGGLAFVVADVDDVDAVVRAFAMRLGELGCRVDHRLGARVFSFERDGVAYRAVFGAAEGGLQVYLGV